MDFGIFTMVPTWVPSSYSVTIFSTYNSIQQHQLDKEQLNMYHYVLLQ
jgi:hypothetical protein